MTKVDVRGAGTCRPGEGRPNMRAAVKASIFLLTLAAAACGHGGAVPAGPARASEGHVAAAIPAGPAQYVVADPSARGNVVAVPLGAGGALGLVVDKTRIVIGRGEPKVGVDLPDKPIAGAARIPGRFGGGFLFWTDTEVYRSESFDGVLKPIARMPDSIQVISFAPKFLLVRTRNGERWALGIPSGERRPIEPLGAADVEGLDDGRALAFDDQGAAFSSVDHGAHWVDVTSQIKSSPSRVAVIDEEIWLFESSGSALRLETDGQLEAFDKQPVEKPPEMRALDARWRGTEAPLRTVFHAGATIDENTAIVVEQGDIVRVDVHTGEITGIVPGKLPPDARCEAVPTANDVLFACVTRGTSGTGVANAFVVSHTLSGDAPTVEQTFTGVAPFYGSDDGGLAFGAACNLAQGAPVEHAVCVRQPGGTWQEYDLSALGGDAGPNDVTVARWVPRADGRAVAILTDPTPGIYDPRTGNLETLEPLARDVLTQGLTPSFARARRRVGGGSMSVVDGVNLVDWSWSFSASGSLRGWQRQGGATEITDDGKVVRSPYAFDLVASGPFAIGRSPEGRFYQSTDHGGSWVEVAAPPSGSASGDLRACSSAGCDLGGFYRVGWAVRPPRIEAAPTAAKPAPEVRRTRPVEIACRPTGPAQSRVLARTANSPDDLGLGNSRLQVAGERSELSFIRNGVPRGIAHPLHETSSGDSDTPSIRGLLTGFGTNVDGSVIEVTGPNKSPAALRRGFSFVPAFDPSAPVKKTTFAMSDVLSVGRAAGMTNDEILSDDMTESGNVIVVTPHDASAGSDLAFQNPRGLLALVHANERTKLAMRPAQNEGTIISGVGLGGDEAAFLELESSGVGHVFRIGAAGVTELFDVNPTANDTAFYPANPDALAVGPRGDLAIIRLGSGSDPASAQDPALLIVPAQPPVALAPWSTLRPSDDAACKAEPGWRTTIQVIAPWMRTTTPELRVDDVPMIARVKWSDKRVCLEGIELKLADVSIRAPGTNGAELLKVGSWLVSRGGVFGRIAVAEGVEWRQPLECSFVAKP